MDRVRIPSWRSVGLAIFALSHVLALAVASPSSAQDFSTHRLVSGLARPVFLTAPPQDFTRVFIAEQHTGEIKILRLADESLLAEPFLDLDGISTGNEQGLLGVAFHPDYQTNGFVYVYVTDPTSRVLRFRVSNDADVADPDSQLQIIAFGQPQPNHNGGWIGFGPDGALYIATGDGGSSNDDGNGHTPGIGNAQDLTDNLLGKILRIDVDGDDFPMDGDRNYAIPFDNPFVSIEGDDEIWAYGLRNPYRASFDRQSGDLFIGDVGQINCEEINLLPAGSRGGENFGWRLREGVIATPTGGVGGPRPAGALDPIMDYPRPGAVGQLCSGPPVEFEGIAVTGGVVYRGPEASIAGRYFFADFFTGEVWSFLFDGSDAEFFDGTNYTDLTNHALDPRFVPDIGSISSISSFGEDAAGRLYVLDLADGEVFRVPEPSTFAARSFSLLTVGLIVAWRRRFGP